MFGGQIGGWGEAAWIKDGEVVSASVGKNCYLSFEQNTVALLE